MGFQRRRFLKDPGPRSEWGSYLWMVAKSVSQHPNYKKPGFFCFDLSWKYSQMISAMVSRCCEMGFATIHSSVWFALLEVFPRGEISEPPTNSPNPAGLLQRCGGRFPRAAALLRGAGQRPKTLGSSQILRRVRCCIFSGGKSGTKAENSGERWLDRRSLLKLLKQQHVPSHLVSRGACSPEAKRALGSQTRRVHDVPRHESFFVLLLFCVCSFGFLEKPQTHRCAFPALRHVHSYVTAPNSSEPQSKPGQVSKGQSQPHMGVVAFFKS